LEYPVIIRDREAISRLVKGVLAQKNFVYCRVDEVDGTLLYQEGNRGNGPSAEYSLPVISKRVDDAESLIIEVPQEVTEEVGKVTLAVSLSELNTKITNLRITITSVIFVMIIVFSLGTYLFLVHLVGKPVGQLVKATKRIAGGDLVHKVSLTTKDEFEILGDSFDGMMESLLVAQQELVHREKLAVLGDLAGGVGNELRNPLGVMTNAVFFLKCTLPDNGGQTREYLDIIQTELDNCRRILSDFVDFFRLEKPNRKPVAIHTFIHQSVELSDMPDSVTLRDDIPADLPPVNVDSDQMRQVFHNLLTNAIQVMPNGGSVHMRAKKVLGKQNEMRKREGRDLEPFGDFIEISVSDTGTGISPENITKVFQPLFTTKSRGIGLGLAICQSYVEANGGSIHVESQLGMGTTFKVLLPAENSR
jgi:signal transduction histidine kinase